MKKTAILLLISATAVIGSSMATFIVKQPTLPKRRTIMAGGRMAISAPLNLPQVKSSGNDRSGSIILGTKDDCDITYDQFLVTSWSEKEIPGHLLVPAKSYEIQREERRRGLGGRLSPTSRVMHLAANKPCGRVVREQVYIIEQYCPSEKIYVAIAGKLDPYLTEKMIVEIANSMKCP
jgi:hypothetical protein